jgi:hypothetical protein
LDDLTEEANPHFIHSTLRERIVEHVFVGEALRRLWQLGVTDVEVLRSEFDAGGYDLVMARGRVTRHIQFKTKIVGGKTDEVKISLKLMDKPSGCVLWIVVTPDLLFDHYLWFGAGPGEPLPDINAFAVAKHSKGTAQGEKNERPNHRRFGSAGSRRSPLLTKYCFVCSVIWLMPKLFERTGRLRLRRTGL